MDYPAIVILLGIQESIDVQQEWSKGSYEALRSLGRGYSCYASRFEERSEVEDENLIYPQRYVVFCSERGASAFA